MDLKKAFGNISRLILLCLVAGAVFAVVRTNGQENTTTSTVSATNDQWEYLALAGPTTTSFSPSGNPRMRKDSSGGFAREAFVLEQHLDKLGKEGWELVAIGGPPTDPAYYFRRRK
jgi:hypothetical protein